MLAVALSSRRLPPLAFLTLLVLPLASSCAGAAQGMIGLMPGVVTDPSNKALRHSILAFGMGQFCHEMTNRDAPLALAPSSPVVGRFYPAQCQTQELQNGDWFVQFSGFGYAWTNLSRKVTFTMSGAVDYNADFQMSGSTMYIYFRPRQVTASNFATHVIEQPVASFLNSVSNLSDTFGRQLVNGQLGAGFTVIRESNGSADFAVGFVETGKRPQHPVDVHGSDRVTWENARVEVHGNERDFAGPIEVKGSGRAIYVNGQVDGIPAIDVLLLRKDVGDASLQLFFNYPQSGPLSGPPLAQVMMQQGAGFSHAFPVPEGQYYVVFDNTASAGVAAPAAPLNLMSDSAAVVSYAVQIGDAP